MPYKDKDKRKQYNKNYGSTWYERNRETVIARTKLRRQKEREKYRKYKAGLSCFFCGFSHPAAIDFHHREAEGDPKVHELLSSGKYKKMWEEIEKCIPLCANCHRIYHWMEQEGKKVE